MVAETTTTLEKTTSDTGDQLNPTGTTAAENIEYLKGDFFRYAIAGNLQTIDIDGTPIPPKGIYKYTKEIDVKSILIKKNSSIARAIVESNLFSTIAPDYDTFFGVAFKNHYALRHFILVVQLYDGKNADFVEPTLPAEDDAYEDDLTILFSGFSGFKAGLDFRDDEFDLSYAGIENIANDIKIVGSISYDTQSVLPKNNSAKQNIKFITHDLEKCIFNKNGKPDQLITSGGIFPNGIQLHKDSSQTAGVNIKNTFFNRTGFGKNIIKFWTLKDILDYVLLWYLVAEESNDPLDTALPAQHFNLVRKIPNYLIFDDDFPDLTKMQAIVPMNFSLEGLGVYDAYKKIVAESKSYFLQIKYKTDGVAIISLKLKDTTGRDTKDMAMPLSRGDIDVDYDKDQQDIVEDSKVYFDRSKGSLGKVIVKGAKVKINTLVTTMTNPEREFDGSDDGYPLFSSTRLTITQQTGGIQDFNKFMGLVITDDLSRQGLPKHLYKIHNFNLIRTDTTLGIKPIKMTDLGLTLADLNNDDPDNLLLFKSLKMPKLFDKKQRAFSDRNEREDLPIEFFFTQLSDRRKDSVKSPIVELIFPYERDEGGTSKRTYMFIQPLERISQLNVQTIRGDLGGFVVFEQGGDTVGSNIGETLIEEYFNNSDADSQLSDNGLIDIPTIGKDYYMWVRCSIEIDYRIKGIAEINLADHGADFSEDEHEILEITDESFQLDLNYLDATFSDDNKVFSAIADGFIPLAAGGVDPKRKDPLTSIQDRAEQLLEKYTRAQNTGKINITGVQAKLKMGDYITEIGSGTRKFDFPSIINTVEYDLKKRMTKITLGSFDD